MLANFRDNRIINGLLVHVIICVETVLKNLPFVLLGKSKVKKVGENGTQNRNLQSFKFSNINYTHYVTEITETMKKLDLYFRNQI